MLQHSRAKSLVNRQEWLRDLFISIHGNRCMFTRNEISKCVAKLTEIIRMGVICLLVLSTDIFEPSYRNTCKRAKAQSH